MSSSVPKSRRACSGRLAKASLRSTLTTGTPRALQDSTKRAPMKPAAPVTRRVSGALTPPILRDLAWHLHVFFLCSRHDDQRVREASFSPLQRRHARGRGRSLERALHGRHLNRVTDTCIPEEEAIRRIERAVLDEWTAADRAGKQYFPHEFMYRILLSGKLKEHYQIDPKDSWLLAAAERNLPIFVPGWEDSTLGNIFAAHCIEKEIQNVHTVRTGIEYMTALAEWYTATAPKTPVGFFQIGGGIAGDFPICVVPMLHQDLRKGGVPLWAYFCQISDSTTSLGSYSGAVPNEKITWGKLGEKTPRFIIESDATIVAPLMFAYVLGW